MIAMALLLVTAGSPPAAQVESLVVERTNALRESEGAGRLRPDDRLARVARDFATTLSRLEALEHDADGSTIPDRIRRSGYRPCAWAENIAYEYRTGGFAAPDLAAAFVKDWLDSAGHRRNLLSRDVKDIGVGVARSAKTGRVYGVQVFARECPR